MWSRHVIFDRAVGEAESGKEHSVPDSLASESTPPGFVHSSEKVKSLSLLGFGLWPLDVGRLLSSQDADPDCVLGERAQPLDLDFRSLAGGWESLFEG